MQELLKANLVVPVKLFLCHGGHVCRGQNCPTNGVIHHSPHLTAVPVDTVGVRDKAAQDPSSVKCWIERCIVWAGWTSVFRGDSEFIVGLEVDAAALEHSLLPSQPARMNKVSTDAPEQISAAAIGGARLVTLK